jgi:hypothetical protein
MEKLEVLRRYFLGQIVFLRSPWRFASETDFAAAKTKLDAFAFLMFGGTASIIIGRVNINLYGERIRRVLEVSDTVEELLFYSLSLAVFGLLAFVAFRVVGGKASLIATTLLLMDAVAFTAPVLTLFLILVTRLESAMLDTTLVLSPPKRIIPFDSFPDTPSSQYLQYVFSFVMLAWNLYFGWLVWSALRTLHKVGRLKAAFGLIITVGFLYMSTGVINRAVNSSVEPTKPIWEWIFK